MEEGEAGALATCSKRGFDPGRNIREGFPEEVVLELRPQT